MNQQKEIGARKLTGSAPLTANDVGNNAPAYDEPCLVIKASDPDFNTVLGAYIEERFGVTIFDVEDDDDDGPGGNGALLDIMDSEWVEAPEGHPDADEDGEIQVYSHTDESREIHELLKIGAAAARWRKAHGK